MSNRQAFASRACSLNAPFPCNEHVQILLTADPVLPVPPPGYGGIERIVGSLVQAFACEGHEVGLVAHPESTAVVAKLFPWPASVGQNFRNHGRNISALNRAIRSFRPDIVHSFSRLIYLMPRLASRSGPTVMSYQRHTGGRALTLAAALGGKSFAFTGCSEFVCRQGRPRGGSWHAIPNFVDVSRIPFTATARADAPLLFLSRMEAIKGPDLAIAIARAAGRRLILAGNRVASPDGNAFWESKIAPELARGDVEWVGEVNDAEKWRLLGEASGSPRSHPWDEPFGIVFVEALAAGVPVITCARGATPEIIEPGRTGFFITGSKTEPRPFDFCPLLIGEPAARGRRPATIRALSPPGISPSTQIWRQRIKVHHDNSRRGR